MQDLRATEEKKVNIEKLLLRAPCRSSFSRTHRTKLLLLLMRSQRWPRTN